MSLFRRCQRFQPLLAKGYRSTNAMGLNSIAPSIISSRFGGGGGGDEFPRGALDMQGCRTNNVKAEKFPKQLKAWDGMANMWFYRYPKLDGDRPPKETPIFFVCMGVLWIYGLWYNSKYNPHGH